MDCDIQVVKNKSKDLTNINNYRAIVLPNVFSKLMEAVLSSKLITAHEADMYNLVLKILTLQ